MRNIKQFLIFTTCLLLILTTCVGCNKYPNEPFNGEVEFGDITITIPDTYIRVIWPPKNGHRETSTERYGILTGKDGGKGHDRK